MSGDGFHYLRSWLVGKGKAAVEQALSDPDELGAFLDTDDPDNELLEYVAFEVLGSWGSDIDPRADVAGDADREPEGEPFDEEKVEDLYPKLAAIVAAL